MKRRLPLTGLLVAACLALLWFSQDATRQRFRHEVALRSAGARAGHRALADWLSHAAAKGDSIALMDIGIVGYYCIDQAIIDVTGLTDRHIAKSPGRFLRKEYDPAYVLDHDPRFVVLTLTAFGSEGPPGFWTGIESRIYRHPRFRERYLRPGGREPESGDRLGVLARRVGAEKVFEYSHPEGSYLLAVFRRHLEVEG